MTSSKTSHYETLSALSELFTEGGFVRANAVQPVTFPRFPTLSGLLEQPNTHPFLQLAPGPAPTPTESLFQGLLQGKWLPLYQDSLDHPERYDENTKTLLTELAAGTRKLEGLTSEDKKQLDLATLDFAAYVPPKQQQPKQASVRRAITPKLMDDAVYDAGTKTPDFEPPGSPLSSYWWLPQ